MRISDINPYTFKKLRPQIEAQIAEEARQHLIVFKDGDLVARHLSANSLFCHSAVSMGYLSQEQINHAARRYRLGLSRDGGVIFWQIDHLQQLYDGKIMYYRPDCHRDHHHHPTWVMSELKRFCLRGDYKLIQELPSQHCLFGTHLLAESKRDVVVVEAEKTAVIMSEIYPQYLWMAAGGLTELNDTKLFPLRGRKIIIIPDTDEQGQAYSYWSKICRKAQILLGQPIHLTPFLEQKASLSQKRRKIDFLDYYFETIKPR